jgi:DNA polymerase
MSDSALPGQLALFSLRAFSKPDPQRLEALRADALRCQKCAIRKTCKQVVLGSGRVDRPVIAFVGEAPGTNEDSQGLPIVGTSRGLLERMLQAMHLRFEDVYFCNLLACRPPEGRPPAKDELANCYSWYSGQLRFTQPQVVVALGAFVGNVLLESKKPEPLNKLRGSWHEWQGLPLRVTFALGHLHRHPLDKEYAWVDLQAVQKWLQSPQD